MNRAFPVHRRKLLVKETKREGIEKAKKKRDKGKCQKSDVVRLTSPPDKSI